MRVALLIDLENLHGSLRSNSDLSILDDDEVVQPLLTKVVSECEGDQLVAKEYFSVNPATGDLLKLFGLNHVIHRLSVGRKNAADITLACHAVQQLIRDDVQRFYIVSGDSDMIDLALFLEEAGSRAGRTVDCHLLPLSRKKGQVSDQLFRWAEQHELNGRTRLHFLSVWLDLDQIAKDKRAKGRGDGNVYARALTQILWFRWTSQPRGFLWREAEFLDWATSASSEFAHLGLSAAQATSIIAQSLRNYRFAGTDRQRFSYAHQGLRRTLLAGDVAVECVATRRRREASFGDVIQAIEEVPASYLPADLRPNELLQLAVAAGLLSQVGDTISIANEDAPFGPISGLRRVILAAAVRGDQPMRWFVFLDPFARGLFRMSFNRLSRDIEQPRIEAVRRALVNQASVQGVVLKCDEAGHLQNNGRFLKLNGDHELVQETLQFARRTLKLVEDEPNEDVLYERMGVAPEIGSCRQERRSILDAMIAANLLRVQGQPRRFGRGRFGL